MENTTPLKNYYLLMHFGNPATAVTGMLVLNQPDPESARKAAIRQVQKDIVQFTLRYGSDDTYRHIERLKSFRKPLSKPWRNHTRKYAGERIAVDNYLEILELPADVFYTTYWLNFGYETYLCNVPRTRTQYPKHGYVVSQILQD